LTTFIDHRLDPGQKPPGGAAMRPRVSPKKVPDDTRPTERHFKTAGWGSPRGPCRGGRRGFVARRSHGRLKPWTRRATYYLEPRHSLVKEQLPSAAPVLEAGATDDKLPAERG